MGSGNSARSQLAAAVWARRRAGDVVEPAFAAHAALSDSGRLQVVDSLEVRDLSLELLADRPRSTGEVLETTDAGACVR